MASPSKTLLGKYDDISTILEDLTTQFPSTLNFNADATLQQHLFSYLDKSNYKRNFLLETEKCSFKARFEKITLDSLKMKPYYNDTLKHDASRTFPTQATNTTAIFTYKDRVYSHNNIYEKLKHVVAKNEAKFTPSVLNEISLIHLNSFKALLMINRVPNYSAKVTFKKRKIDETATNRRKASIQVRKSAQGINFTKVTEDMNKVNPSVKTETWVYTLPPELKGQNLSIGLRAPSHFKGQTPGHGDVSLLMSYAEAHQVEMPSEVNKRAGLKRSMKQRLPKTLDRIEKECPNMKSFEAILDIAKRTFPLEDFGVQTCQRPPMWCYYGVDPFFFEQLQNYLKNVDCSLPGLPGSNAAGEYMCWLFFYNLLGENMNLIDKIFGKKMKRAVELSYTQTLRYGTPKYVPLTIHWRDEKEGQTSGWGTQAPKVSDEKKEEFQKKFDEWCNPNTVVAEVEEPVQEKELVLMNTDTHNLIKCPMIKGDVFFFSYNQIEKANATVERSKEGVEAAVSEEDRILLCLVPGKDHCRTIASLIREFEAYVLSGRTEEFKLSKNFATFRAFYQRFDEAELTLINMQLNKKGQSPVIAQDVALKFSPFDAMLKTKDNFPQNSDELRPRYGLAWRSAFNISGISDPTQEIRLKTEYPNFSANQLGCYPEDMHNELITELILHRLNKRVTKK